jgi:hypothetical protein
MTNSKQPDIIFFAIFFFFLNINFNLSDDICEEKNFTMDTEFVSYTFVQQDSYETLQCADVLRFCVTTEKRPKQYIKRKKSTFAEKILKILKLLHGPIFHILWEK